MKRIWGTLSLLVISLIAGAEQLTFITTMSGPVGSFAQVESNSDAQAQQVTLHRVGTVQLKGTESKLGNVVLNGGTLSGTTPEFRVKALTVGDGGVVKGGRLIAEQMPIQVETTMVVAEKLYNSGTLTVGRAGADTMTITDKATITTQDSVPGKNLGWYANTQTPSGPDTTKANEILLKSPSATSDRAITPKEQGPTVKTWLSPVAYCTTVNISTGALNSGSAPASFWLQRGITLNPQDECSTRMASSDSWYGCDLIAAVREQELTEAKGWYQNKPTHCNYGEECDCIPGNKYYVGSPRTVCTPCWDTNSYLWGMGSVRAIYKVAYAVCAEGETYPFKNITPVTSCNTSTSQPYIPGGSFELLEP